MKPTEKQWAEYQEMLRKGRRERNTRFLSAYFLPLMALILAIVSLVLR